MTDYTAQSMELAERITRGALALAALAEISQWVSDYDSDKRDADAIYSGKIRDMQSVLASRIAGTVHRVNAALETVGEQDDDIDDDDDD